MQQDGGRALPVRRITKSMNAFLLA